MAEAFIGGLLQSGLCAPRQIRAADPSRERREVMTGRFEIAAGEDNAATAAWADVVVLAVKPQACESVLAGLRSGLSRQLMISIAAGIRLSWLRARVPDGVRLVRVMPNAPALVGAGMSALSGEATGSSDETGLAVRLCEAIGRAEVVEEGLLDAVTGLSGSGPAFVFAALEAMADGGVKAGLPRDLADRLAVGTALGTARMVLDQTISPAAVSDEWEPAAEPARAGMAVLEEGDFRLVVAQAVAAAARRSEELGR